MPSPRAVVILLLSLTAAGCPKSGAAPMNDTITESELRADVFALADDSTKGRYIGTPELARAGDWVRDRFQSLGLEPAGDGSSFDQRFDMMWFSLGKGENSLTVDGAGGPRPFGQGWYPLNFSPTATASGEVVFAGFGIDEPHLAYDDFKGVDLHGKIVLVMDREPGVDDLGSPFDGIVTAEASRSFRKAMAAQKRGAVGLLLVRDIHTRGDITNWPQSAAGAWPSAPRRIETFLLGDWARSITIPSVMISAQLADSLIAKAGTTLKDLALASEAAQRGLGAKLLPGTRVSLTTSVDRHVTPGRNIMAMVRGSDSKLRDEAVIVIGHIDHNGMGGDSIFNGADDNASGAVGVMAVAGAYARALKDGKRPRRTVIFAVDDAEERGPLLGSWSMTLHPKIPLANTVAVINMDMIGRNQEVPERGGSRFAGLEPQSAESNANAVNILGYTRAPELAAAVQTLNTATGSDSLVLRLRYDNNSSNLLRRSDQWPYIENDVPAIWFHTGLHPDYHTPEDDASKLNYPKMTRIVRLVHSVSWAVANADQRPHTAPMGVHPPS